MNELLIAIQNAANTIAAPNWAAIMSVCFSLLAIIVAGFVAWKQIEISRKQSDIADKQNKIALFEKRLEIYDILKSCETSSQILGWLHEDEDILKCLFSSLVKNEKQYQKLLKNEEGYQEHLKNARIYVINCATKLQRATFLFPGEIAPYFVNLSNKLYSLTTANSKDDGPKKYAEKKQAYFKAIDDFDKNGVIKKIEEEMKVI